jgi:hypothetical protein
MKNSIKVAVAALTIASFAFVGCKKGEGDPFLSLLSRKARVVGTWKTTAGEGTRSTTFSSTTTTETITYDGTTETTVTNPGNLTSTTKYTVEYVFEKDGTFKMTNTNNDNSTPIVVTTEGNWNFTGGVGEAKKKSQIVFYVTKITQGSNVDTYTGSNRPTMVMDVYQLKSKEMIFMEKGDNANAATSSTDDMKWTLTAQ